MKKSTIKVLLSVCIIFFSTSCSQQVKSPVSLQWSHMENDIENGICESQLTITNISADTLFENWIIYWNQMSISPLFTEGEQICVTQIQASYHSVTPTRQWQPLPPDSSRTFLLRYKGNIMRRSGRPHAPFIVMDGRKTPIAIPTDYVYSTDGHEFQRKVPTFPYADGEEVYRQNSRFNKTPLPTDEIHLLPQPKDIQYTGGTCNLKRAKVFYDPDVTLPAEGYCINICKDSVFVYVSNLRASLQYAEQTLSCLMEQYDSEVPCCIITDWPDTQHRGFMLDIARNFTPKEEILKIIDLLAMYKMNVLHMHLTDDEGWRIEISGLPELTEVGARRGYTIDERDCLYPMYSGGWNPDDKNASGNGYLTRQDYIEILKYAKQRHINVVPEIDMPGHSRAAIKAMEARYWKYIDTDKEKAEEYLLSDFQDTSRYVSAQHYTDNVICIALPSCYTFCQKVIDEVVDMYREAEAPLEIFHVGGDEVPRGAWLGSPKVAEYVGNIRKSVLENNKPDYTTDSQKQGKVIVTAEDVANLKDSFLETVAAMLAEYGLQTAGWEEVAYRQGQPNPRFSGKNIMTYAWNSVPEWRGDEKPYRLANAGYPVMICSVCNLYMDMCYLNHEEESGLNWGGYVDEYCSFNLRPDSLYLSVRRTMLGKTRNLEEYAASDKTRLIADSAKNLKGIQAQLWSETIRSSEQLERYLLPKLLGTAERAWNQTWQGSYETALNKYNQQLWQHEIPNLHRKNYAFHLSQPGIHREKSDASDVATITMNSAVTGAEIRYTIDGTEPDKNSTLYTEPFESNAELINACCFYLGEKSNITHSQAY